MSPSNPGMCGQLHHTTPGSGVFNHQCAHELPIIFFACLSSVGECGRLLVFEALRRIGVDTSQAEHRCHDVAALDVRCARRRRNVEIARRIDDDVAQDRLAPGLGLADHTLDPAIFHQRAREPGMQPQLNPELLHPFERNALPAVRIERSREADRVRCLVAVEIERPPARPAAITFGQLAPLVLRAETSPASASPGARSSSCRVPRTDISS